MKDFSWEVLFLSPISQSTFGRITTLQNKKKFSIEHLFIKCDQILTDLVTFTEETPDVSAIRQKDESQNGCYKKTNLAKFSEKLKFFSP